MGELVLERVTKRYGKVRAMDEVSLTVRKGELFTLLGPSGCGKSTTLRVIAGLELPDEGRIYLDGEDITYKKPNERNVIMMFQNYALWPHMTVYDNIAYGLRLRRLSEAEVSKRVKWALEMLGLEGMEQRYPLQLSGGQQQRVALARAVVLEPKVLLLDEPLSNLDAKLRMRVRDEIVDLQRRLGITVIYVTHDQEEAMSISDRIAIMDKGRVVQVGSPYEIYHKPLSFFVATFMGRSNVLPARVEGRVSENVYEVSAGAMRIYGSSYGRGLSPGEEVIAVMRYESIRRASGESINVIEGTVERTSFIGTALQAKVLIDGKRHLMAYLSPRDYVETGSRIKLYVSPEDVKLYPLEDVSSD